MCSSECPDETPLKLEVQDTFFMRTASRTHENCCMRTSVLKVMPTVAQLPLLATPGSPTLPAVVSELLLLLLLLAVVVAAVQVVKLNAACLVKKRVAKVLVVQALVC